MKKKVIILLQVIPFMALSILILRAQIHQIEHTSSTQNIHRSTGDTINSGIFEGDILQGHSWNAVGEKLNLDNDRDGDGLSDSLEAALSGQFAPKMWFHSNEGFCFGRMADDSIPTFDTCDYSIYTHVYPRSDHIEIQYWFIYPEEADHHWDTEHISLKVRNGAVEYAYYAAHAQGNPQHFHSAKALEWDGEHPVVYVEKSKHGSYPSIQACTEERGPGLAEQGSVAYSYDGTNPPINLGEVGMTDFPWLNYSTPWPNSAYYGPAWGDHEAEWFNGAFSVYPFSGLIDIFHDELPSTPDTINSYIVSAYIYSVKPLTEDSLFVFYSTNDSYTPLPLLPTGNPFEFSVAIPAQPPFTTVNYYLSAKNVEGTTEKLPKGAPTAATFTFYVGLDWIPPTITVIDTLPHTIDQVGPYRATIFVTDNYGDLAVDTNSVYLHFDLNGGQIDSSSMQPTENPGEYQGEISFGEILSTGDVINYYFTANDTSRNHNRAYSDHFQFDIVVEMVIDNFESGTEKWDLGSGWGLSGFGYNSTHSIKNSPVGQYINNADDPLTLLQSLNLSTYSIEHSLALSFWTSYRIEADKDFCFVEASSDSINWTILGSYTGQQTTWIQGMHSLDDFTGPGNENVHIRFRLVSDSTDTDKGIRIDNVEILVRNPTSVERDSYPGVGIPENFSLSQNYPNPFNSKTIITYHLPVAYKVTLKIFNILGREVKTLVNNQKEAGYFTAHWDGRNDRGREVASGIYIYRIEIQTVTQETMVKSRKLMLLR